MLFPNGHPSADTEIRREQIRSILADSDDVLDDRVVGEIELDYYQKVLDDWNSHIEE